MQRFEVEDEVELADIFKEAVERLHEDLDQIEKGEGRFGGGAYDDEVEGSVVSVGDERRRVVVLGGGGVRYGRASQERRETVLCQWTCVDKEGACRTVGSCMLSWDGWRPARRFLL